jgi:hypothetical protein
MSIKTKSQSVTLNKVTLNNLPNVGVLVVKVDNRVNNTGRPVDKTSARYKRLAKQAFYAMLNKKFVNGNAFKIGSESYVYKQTGKELGIIKSNVTGYVCNVDYIGRTKVTGFTFVLGKQVKIELNLKTLQFVS